MCKYIKKYNIFFFNSLKIFTDLPNSLKISPKKRSFSRCFRLMTKTQMMTETCYIVRLSIDKAPVNRIGYTIRELTSTTLIFEWNFTETEDGIKYEEYEKYVFKKIPTTGNK